MTENHPVAVEDDLTEMMLFHKILKEENLDEQS